MRTRTLAIVISLAGLALLAAGCLSTPLEEAEAGVENESIPYEGNLSPVQFEEITRSAHAVSSSEDDAELRVDVYKPEGAEEPLPTILVLSPYWSFLGDSKDEELNEGYPAWYVDYFVPRGYAVALGEMRGTRDSGGCWDFGGEFDQQDGHDMVQHLADQPWSNGKVGMIGASHVGMSQIAAAITAPENLTTVVPIAAVSDWYRYLHMDGAQYVTNRATPPAYFAVHASPSTQPLTDGSITADWVQTQARTACPDNAEHLSKSAELNGNKGAYWQERDLIAGAENIEASVFLVHGFLDENVKTDHFHDLWKALPKDVEKRGWFGQFGHAHPAYHEWRDEVHAWFDHELKGIDNDVDDRPPVTVQGSDGMARFETAWPPTATQPQNLTLGADGFELQAAGPLEDPDETDVSYWSIPGDDRSIPHDDEARRIVFATDAQDDPLRLSGEPTLTLEASLNQPTGRWIGVLLEADAPHPSAASEVDEITRSYLNAEHRDGNEQGEPVPAGETLEFEMRFFPRDHVVDEGNHLVLMLVGGDMGCMTFGGGTCEGTGILPAEVPVEHTVTIGEESQSRLVLPVLEQAGPERPLTELDGFLDEQPE